MDLGSWDNNAITRFFRKLANKRALKKVVDAGGSQKKVQVKYKKANGEVVTRVVRPYEIKKHRTKNTAMLYVTDNKHGAKQILSLHADKILQAKVLDDTSYKPVWPINLSRDQIKKVKHK
jgi:hypothetical protein